LAGVAVRVLTWNLKHGRAVPPAGRDLVVEFAGALAGWEWDVALLQEVPPWWPRPLARASAAQPRRVLTSRNAGLAVRRALATRWPDLMKSSGGGANAILARGGEVIEHRTRRLCRLPERRWVHGVALRGEAFGERLWVANLHATAHDTAAAVRDNQLAARTALAWCDGHPCVLGGDLNLRHLSLEGFTHAGGHDVDHVFARGLAGTTSDVQVLARGHLSDHAPVLVELAGTV
jgi:endonuclease/exonuclease/phosphatase family metal-dependent hydrolase